LNKSNKVDIDNLKAKIPEKEDVIKKQQLEIKQEKEKNIEQQKLIKRLHQDNVVNVDEQ